jgi:hypothetical protein
MSSSAPTLHRMLSMYLQCEADTWEICKGLADHVVQVAVVLRRSLASHETNLIALDAREGFAMSLSD